MAQPIEYKGIKYRSKQAFGAAFGLTKDKVNKRIAAGWTLAQVVGDEAPPRASHGEVEFNGKTYSGLAVLCDDYGCDLKKVHQRITAGWTLEQALDIKAPRKAGRHVEVEFRGVKYESYKALTEAYGVKYSNFTSRFFQSEMTLEMALGLVEIPAPEGISITYNGITYRNICEMHRAYSHISSISAETFRSRLLLHIKNGRNLNDEIIFFALTSPLAKPDGGGYIYVIENAMNGMKYVGLTTQTIEERFAEHKADAVNGNERNVAGLHYAMWKHGVENFIINKIDELETADELKVAERQWISTLSTLAPNGYNLSTGGTCGGGTLRGYTYEGEKFRSLGAAVRILADRHKLSKGCVKSRLDKGIPLDLPLHGGARKTVVVFGVEYESISEACRIFSMPKGAVTLRMKSGMSIEDALTTPLRDGKIKFNGKCYSKIADLANEYGIEPDVFYKRRHVGWSIEEALEIVPRPSEVWIEFRGEVYKTQADICAAYNVSYTKFKRRIHYGWSLDEALELCNDGRHKPRKNAMTPITVGGIEFRSVNAARKHFGIPNSTLEKRLRNGWSVDEAFGIIKRNEAA